MNRSKFYQSDILLWDFIIIALVIEHFVDSLLALQSGAQLRPVVLPLFGDYRMVVTFAGGGGSEGRSPFFLICLATNFRDGEKLPTLSVVSRLRTFCKILFVNRPFGILAR